LYAQPLRFTSFHFRHLMAVTNAAGAVQEVQSAFGTLSLVESTGRYSMTGSRIVGSGNAEPFTAEGPFAIDTGGTVTIRNPLRTTATIRLQGGREVPGVLSLTLVGTTAGDPTVQDLFVAISRQTGSFVGDAFAGTWDFSGIEVPTGSLNQLRLGAFRIGALAGGSGGTVDITLRSALNGGLPASVSIAGTAYTIARDGTGLLTFPGQSALAGARTIAVSGDAFTALLGSTSNGVHSLWFGLRSTAASASALRTLLNGQFETTGWRLNAGRVDTYTGAIRGSADGPAVSSLLIERGTGAESAVVSSPVVFRADGSGRVDNLTLRGNGSGMRRFFRHSAAEDTVGAPYELSISTLRPSVTGTGVFIAPNGIVNAASFAPAPAPLAPGSFVTIFGSGLAASTTVSSSLPFPSTLGGVRVELNGAAIPLYLVSPTQISALIPLNTAGNSAAFVVVNGAQRSNSVSVPLAPVAPGVFTVPPAGTGPAALLHADFSLVSAASPARPGETVQLFLTGLGEVTPTVNIAAIAPASPLSTVNADLQVTVGGQPATVVYKGLAPGLAGLYQLNFIIPMEAPKGAAVRIGIRTAGVVYEMADVAIQ